MTNSVSNGACNALRNASCNAVSNAVSNGAQAKPSQANSSTHLELLALVLLLLFNFQDFFFYLTYLNARARKEQQNGP